MSHSRIYTFLSDNAINSLYLTNREQITIVNLINKGHISARVLQRLLYKRKYNILAYGICILKLSGNYFAILKQNEVHKIVRYISKIHLFKSSLLQKKMNVCFLYNDIGNIFLTYARLLMLSYFNLR